MPADILTRIQNEIHAFSKGQKKIASYILTNYDKAAFMTASRLGKTVEVSESTVVRFAVELGTRAIRRCRRRCRSLSGTSSPASQLPLRSPATVRQSGRRVQRFAARRQRHPHDGGGAGPARR